MESVDTRFAPRSPFLKVKKTTKYGEKGKNECALAEFKLLRQQRKFASE